MTEIDPKALEHACLCAGHPVHHFDLIEDDLPLRASIVAHARAIEREAAAEARHAAEMRELKERFETFRQEVSDAVLRHCGGKPMGGPLTHFILPAPDPLVEVLTDMECPDAASIGRELRAAMQARGYQVTKIGEAGE